MNDANTEIPVCVIIPAFNRAHMLPRALESVWSQQPMRPAEVLVIDDGSDDDTAQVAAELGATVIRHPQNRGLAAARNTGLHSTSCPWVALLDSDDEWLPHHLTHLWRLRDGHVLVAGSALRCGADPAGDKVHGPMTRKPVILHSGDQLVYPENIIPVSSSMLKRDVAIAAGGFKARHGVVEDLDLWLRMLEGNTGLCSPEVDIIYHVHGDQMSSEGPRMQRGHLAASEAHRNRTQGSWAPIHRWEGVAAWGSLREAVRERRWRDAAGWTFYISSKPHRIRGLLRIVGMRYRSARCAAALHASGLHPEHRGDG
jgi:hypothetical protein